MTDRKHIAVARFSALGDVFMLFSVLEDATFQDSSVSFTLFTRPDIAANLPRVSSIRVVDLDLSGDYRSWLSQVVFFWGWFRSNSPNFVFDAHSHMRTVVFYSVAYLMGYKVKRFSKKRNLRKPFLRKKIKSLPSVQEEISLVLKSFDVKYASPIFSLKPAPENSLVVKKNIWIICPFSSKKTKSWPLDKVIIIIKELLSEGKSIIILGTEDELQNWNYSHPQLSIASDMRFSEKEMWQMAKGAIVCDSANQHIAAAYNVPTVILWMGTSPKAGFRALNNNSISIEPENLNCWPCSIAGLNYCSRKDFACKDIPSGKIFSAVKDLS